MRIIFPEDQRSPPLSVKYLEIISKSDPRFRSAWKSFLVEYPFFNFDYTLESMDYRELLLEDVARNISFVVINDRGCPLAITPLFDVGGFDGQGCMGFGLYRFAPVPLISHHLSRKQNQSIQDFVFAQISELLAECNKPYWLCYADIMSVGTEFVEDQMPARKGGLDVSIHQHILDLTKSEQELWREIRRRAHAEINAGLRTYTFSVFDRTNFLEKHVSQFIKLHHTTSGRKTRPDKTFEEMFKWIERGTAFLVEQKYEGRIVNMTIVEMGKGMATGASTADDIEFAAKVPLMHSMMWQIIKECKERQIRCFNAGETYFRQSLFQQLSKKELSISFFKQGFGERSWPLKRWIVFRDRDEEIKYLEKQILEYKRS